MSLGHDPAGRLQVLLVEDEEANRALVRAVLARSSEPSIRLCELSDAPTLRTAREILAGRAIDVVLLDVRLPDGNGLDLARELAARGEPERPRVIVMSASVLPAERQAAVATGCDAFLGKPFRASELTELMTELLDGAALRGGRLPG